VAVEGVGGVHAVGLLALRSSVRARAAHCK
jgi:hypothetical protein